MIPPRPINTPHALAATVKGRRLDLGLTQAEVAGKAHVSRQWISGLEAGRLTAEVGLVLRVLNVLEVDLIPVAHEDRQAAKSNPAH